MLDSKPDILRDDRTASVVNQSPYFDERLPTIAPQNSASSSPTASPNAQSANGLTAEYFDNSDLTNSVLKRVDSAVDFNWGEGSPDASIGADTFSVRWTGQVRSKYSEAYTFHTLSDDGVRLWVNGQLLIDHWTDHAPTEDTGTISLTADQNYDLKLEYYERGGGATARLFWSSPTQAKEIVPQSQLFSLPPLEQTVSGQALTQLPGEQAKSASSFIDSLGIDTHLRYTDTSYGRFGDVVEPRLQELGIHHIRDGGNNPELFDKLNKLAALGIRSTLVMDPQDGISPTDAVNIVKQVAASAEAVEGPNEWDVHPDRSYKGDFFPNGVRQYQTEMYQALKSDPTTASVSVIAPSMAMPEHANQIGSLHDVTDMGNMHSYAGGNAPTTDYDWRWMPLTKSVSGDRPIVVTETGWHTAPNSAAAVSEQVAAKYIPRQYLENFNWGIQRTFMYELMDEKPQATQENSFGLIRYDGSPKPAFYAVKNLVSLLNDTSSRSTLGTLNFSLTGDTTNLHHTLLQKTNGDYFLVLWSNATSTDATLSQSVTLNLSTPISQATTFLSNRSTDATGQYNAPTQLALNVMDEPLIVKLTPA